MNRADHDDHERIRTQVLAIGEEAGYDLVRVLVFDSRARGDHRANVVSEQ